jgi:tetratricopeptide (TPR) repeat protein
VVRIKLDRPRLPTLRMEGAVVTVMIGDAVSEQPRALAIMRNTSGNRTTAAIPFDDPRTVHRLVDPEAGDTVLVVTALGPPRGFIKGQDFVDFRVLASSHGVAIQPIADDLAAETTGDKIVLARPNGLALSAAGDLVGRRTGLFRPAAFDPQLWGFDREADFEDRRFRLLNAAADALETKRAAPRLELARFYLARDMYPEAKGVLDVALGDEKPTEDPSGLIMRAFANIMLGRVDEAAKDLANPIVGNQQDARLWRALAFARQGHWAEAHDHFKDVEAAISTLPIELQRLILKEAVRASVEVRDFETAANQLHGFETLGVSKDLEPEIAVLAGRIAEGLGRSGDALVAYRLAASSASRPAAAQGRLRETKLRYALGDLKRTEVIADLEELTAVWRGDETEIEALQALARIYTEEARHRDAFHVMRTALMAHPNSDMTRRIQEEAAKTFDALFLAGKGDAMPVIDALGLFYDFRELTPIGRRGDEMIRRLADRLVSVDLLDQATELLQHQVDHRLQGAARAQVATRLSVIYLMNRKPDRALATLHATQSMSLSAELRQQRLLIEARALSDVGRPDVALEVIANIDAREANRLRADILWSAKRWRESAEQIEVLYGDRWRDWQPLADTERADLLRAAVGYALAQDMLGLDRFRERYAPKMNAGPERRAFEVATDPVASNAAEFRTLARTIASGDTLEGFLREMRARYPEIGSFTAPGNQTRAPLPDPTPTAALTPAAARAAPSALSRPWPSGWGVPLDRTN